MKKQLWMRLAVAVTLLTAFAFLGYRRWLAQNEAARGDVLALMPADANAVLFADFEELRRAPFIGELYAWAPKPQTDPDYAQFIKETGFDYERDLDHIAIAVEKRGQDSTLFAVVDGKFDPENFFHLLEE